MNYTPNAIEALRTEIKQEIHELEELEAELNDYVSRIKGEPENMELRAIGSALHDFYSGIEKVFELIAKHIDEDVPEGEDWHNRLLLRMQGELDGIRPAVISRDLREELEEYLRFRHVFRNIYGYKLNWHRMRGLVDQFPDVLSEFQNNLNSFLKHLTEIQKDL